MQERAYPRLVIDLDALYQNAAYLIGRCRERGIAVAGVIKGFNGLIPAARVIAEAGVSELASSRIEQLAAVKEAGLVTPTLLLRVPMPSELSEVARFCDLSLQSERAVLDALDRVCRSRGVRHRVIVMADLGDLREGFWDKKELTALCAHIERDLAGIELAGVGTNLGCYGSVTPTVEKMEELISVAEAVERAVGRRLQILSGGASSSYPLVDRGTMPKRINHLRIGEGMCLGTLLLKGWELPHLPLSEDAFLLEAEVVECKKKPTFPVGEIAFDAFGNRPVYEDRGERQRALIGVGRVDTGDPLSLVPLTPGALVLGGSSDHTIVDVEDCQNPVRVGDILRFRLSYGALVALSGRADVRIEYISRQDRYER